MSWTGMIAVIIFAVVIEFAARYLTRNMEDKKKREKFLALIWVLIAVILLVIWWFMR